MKFKIQQAHIENFNKEVDNAFDSQCGVVNVSEYIARSMGIEWDAIINHVKEMGFSITNDEHGTYAIASKR